MDIYAWINQKQIAAIHGEHTGINFPYLSSWKKESDVQRTIRLLSGN